MGTVLAVGPGKLDPEDGTRIPVGVKRGDRVVFSRYGVHEVREGELIVVEGENVLGILHE